MSRWMPPARVMAAAMAVWAVLLGAVGAPAVAQDRMYLARTDTCTPACRGSILTIDPVSLSIVDRMPVEGEVGSQPYLTPDGRTLVWFDSAFRYAGPYALQLFDVASRRLTSVPWPGLPTGRTLGSSQRFEIYAPIAGEVQAVSPAGARTLPSPAECLGGRAPTDLSANGERLLAGCSSVPASISYVIDLPSSRIVWQQPGSFVGRLSRDGRTIFSSLGDQVGLVDLDDGHEIARVPAPLGALGEKLRVDPVSGRLLAVGVFTAMVYDPATLQALGAWELPWIRAEIAEVSSVGFAGGDRLFVASGSPVQSSPTFGRYYVLDALTGAVDALAATAAGLPDTGWFVPAPTPPAPASLVAQRNGSSVRLTWQAAGLPAATTRYVLEVGSAPGLGDIVSGLDVGLQTSFGATAVPSGTYYVRVRAGNYSGLGAASNEVAVVVP